MIRQISSQKATAIAKKYFNGELPKLGDSFLLPTGAKLRRSEYVNTGWCIVCYTYNPAQLELAPLNLTVS